jgi:hypothetical protein
MTTETEREKCDRCGGDVPPEPQWGRAGERSDGDCPGHQRRDGMCGAFGPRAGYQQSPAAGGGRSDPARPDGGV